MTLQDNSTLGEINRNYWNDKTETVWSEEWVKTLTRQVTTHLQTNKQWIGITSTRPGESIRLLDYACGNGAASSALSPDVAIIRGIDVSEAMVDRFNEAARIQGFSTQKVQALQGDLLAPGDRISEPLMGPDMFEFDVAVMSMALHHVQDPLQMMKKLAERLRIGGSLLIIDWATEPTKKSTGLHHGHGEHLDLAKIHETMAQASFDKDEMIDLFRNAGCSDVRFELHPEVSVLPENFGGEKQLFFARVNHLSAFCIEYQYLRLEVDICGLNCGYLPRSELPMTDSQTRVAMVFGHGGVKLCTIGGVGYPGNLKDLLNTTSMNLPTVVTVPYPTIPSIQRRWVSWSICNVSHPNITCNYDGAETSPSLHAPIASETNITAHINALPCLP